MSDDDTKLVYVPNNVVELATNTFVDVPVILQYDKTPIISTSKVEEAGYTVEFGIYHSDGTYLAKVVGPRLFATEDGKKAGLVMRHLPGVTACELAGQTLFEIRRTEAAALKTHAELYAPDGAFLKANDHGVGILNNLQGQQPLKIGQRKNKASYNKGTIGSVVIEPGAALENTGTIGLAIIMPGAAIEASGGKFTGPKVALLMLSGNVSYLDIPEIPKALAERYEPERKKVFHLPDAHTTKGARGIGPSNQQIAKPDGQMMVEMSGKMLVGQLVYDSKTGKPKTPESSPES